MPDPKWIKFVEIGGPPERKTIIWEVVTIRADPCGIGEVKWYGAWRRYCFYPYPHTIFEQDCLRDIAEFCETRTKTHNDKRKAEKETERGTI